MSYVPRRWKLAKQLCKEMEWTDDWRVWTQALTMKKLEQLLKRLGIEPDKADKK